jgi:hypothetical protein
MQDQTLVTYHEGPDGFIKKTGSGIRLKPIENKQLLSSS